MKFYDFTSNANPFGPSKKVRNALRKNIKRVNFPEKRERNFLKRSIAARENLKEGEISFFSSLPLFFLFLFQLFSVESIGLFPPVSGRVEGIFKSLEAIGKGVSVKIVKGESLEGIDMLFLIYPHDVYGVSLPIDFNEILLKARSSGIPVIVDETMRQFTDLSALVPPLDDRRKIIVFRGLSEFYGMEGIPFFCLFGEESFIKRIDPFISLEGVPSLTYSAFRAAIKDKNFKKRSLSLIEEEKRYISHKAKKIEGLHVEDTGCHFLLLRGPFLREETVELLRKEGFKFEVYRDEERGMFIRLPIRKRKLNALFMNTIARVTN